MKQTKCSNFLETDRKIFTEAPVVQQFAGLPHLGMSAVAGGVLVPVWSGGLASVGRQWGCRSRGRRRGALRACVGGGGALHGVWTGGEVEGAEDRLGQSPKAGLSTECRQIVKDVITCLRGELSEYELPSVSAA